MDRLRDEGQARDLLLDPAILEAAATQRLPWPAAARVIGGLCVLSWIAIAFGMVFVLS